MLIYTVFDVDVDDDEDDIISCLVYYLRRELYNIALPIIDETFTVYSNIPLKHNRLHCMALDVFDVVYNSVPNIYIYRYIVIRKVSITSNRLKVIMEFQHEL